MLTQLLNFSSSNEPEKVICFNRHNNNENSIKNFLTQFILQFVEKYSFYIMWLYALGFVTCKVSVDVSLFHSKLLHAKLSLFVFGSIFAELDWQLISICSCFIRD